MEVKYLGFASQVIVAILSIVFIKKYKSPFYFFLCMFFLIVVITESLGSYNVIRNEMGKPIFNHLPFAAFLQFNLIALMYGEIIKDKIRIKIIVGLSILLSIFCVKTYFDYQLFRYLVIFGCLNTSFFSFLYLRELLQSDKIIDYKKHFPFWVSVGFLVFYLPSIPFFIRMPYLQGRDLFFLLEILIIVMNLFIIYGLLWSKKEVKY